MSYFRQRPMIGTTLFTLGVGLFCDERSSRYAVATGEAGAIYIAIKSFESKVQWNARNGLLPDFTHAIFVLVSMIVYEFSDLIFKLGVKQSFCGAARRFQHVFHEIRRSRHGQKDGNFAVAEQISVTDTMQFHFRVNASYASSAGGVVRRDKHFQDGAVTVGASDSQF